MAGHRRPLHLMPASLSHSLLALTVLVLVLVLSINLPLTSASKQLNSRSDIYRNKQVDTRVLRFRKSKKWKEAVDGSARNMEGKEGKAVGCSRDADCEGLDLCAWRIVETDEKCVPARRLSICPIPHRQDYLPRRKVYRVHKQQ